MEAMTTTALTHVSAAAIALVAGTLAATLGKGTPVHKLLGYAFVVSMVLTVVPVGFVSYQIGKPFDVFSSLLTCYFVLTGLLAFKSHATPQAIALTGLAGICIVGYMAVEAATIVADVRGTDAPVGAGFVFATILGVACWGDIKRFRQPLSRKQTLMRHLWRMNFGLFMATANLFGVRPHLFPDWLQSSGALLLLTFAPLLVIAYWRTKLRQRVVAAA